VAYGPVAHLSRVGHDIVLTRGRSFDVQPSPGRITLRTHPGSNPVWHGP
jgi:hypothetical protein